MNKSNTGIIIVGAVIGAVIGGVAANILIQQSAQVNKSPKLTVGQGVQVGMGLLAVLRTIAEAAQRS